MPLSKGQNIFQTGFVPSTKTNWRHRHQQLQTSGHCYCEESNPFRSRDTLDHVLCNGKAAQQHKDRPDPQLVAKNAGTPQEDLVSASYTLHFLPVRLWFPLLRFRMRLSRDGQGHKRAVSNAQRRLHCQHLRVLANTQLFQVD